jgi:NAD(P)-dependent dehydrogenase (short-subunit alcohol dehydrogenase family)
MARVALVTGGTRGIGAAIAKALKAGGYKVAANYGGNDDAAQRFKAESGIPVFKWDVSSYEACADGIKKVEAEVGPIEVLVNNAGITRDAMFHRMQPDQHKSRLAVQHVPAGHRGHAGAQVWPHYQHLLDQRAERPNGTDQLFCCQGGGTRIHESARARGRTLGHYGECDLPWLYQYRDGASSAEGRVGEVDTATDPDRPLGRTGGNSALRRVSRLRRCRSNYRRNA